MTYEKGGTFPAAFAQLQTSSAEKGPFLLQTFFVPQHDIVGFG
jgi:hypothetical protein